MSFKPISRRTVLRGLGAAVALPMLDAMAPAIASAASASPTPLRMAMFFLPNGMNLNTWRGKEGDADHPDLPPTLQPLAELRSEFSILRGLTLDGARAHGDGGGDHARSAAAFLTGMHPYKTAGSDIRLGISMDQVAANAVGQATRLPSLELGLEASSTAGECDSGYSCAYVSNIAWRGASNPLPHEVNPAAVFERMFGSEDERANAVTRARRLAERKSILDFVSDDAKSLSRQLGRADQQKLDEYATSVREIEKQIDKARAEQGTRPEPDMARPAGVPHEFEQHMDLMCDLLVLAFRMDLTRISTFMVARDGSERTFRNLGISEGHHSLSHHGSSEQKLEALAKIDHFHVERFARFLQKLQSIKEGENSLLDNSMIVYGAGIADGNRHNHDDLPILLAGRAAGAFNPGRQIEYARNTPLCNLYLTMLDRIGAHADRFGDSTGRLTDL